MPPTSQNLFRTAGLLLLRRFGFCEFLLVVVQDSSPDMDAVASVGDHRSMERLVEKLWNFKLVSFEDFEVDLFCFFRTWLGLF